MDPLFERFERLLRSYIRFGAPSDEWFEQAQGDTDYQEAWNELDEFLRNGSSSDRSNGSGRTTGSSKAGTTERLPPEELRKDYSLLGVAFGATFTEVRNAYRRLMRTHHPDLHASDSNKQREATHTSQQLNTAYQRIKAWEAAKRGA
ncbi:MAG: J domain-containing protein [Spirochaetaceae bacterium]|nr:J domain-containing protein [Spirochaetaceae bacterium]MCF7947534.1 J domain-containing protein [Spirochaetia bacterium]MCF7951417.1 J domain-containing protein [Spirochaetaceae bacterium]